MSLDYLCWIAFKPLRPEHSEKIFDVWLTVHPELSPLAISRLQAEWRRGKTCLTLRFSHLVSAFGRVLPCSVRESIRPRGYQAHLSVYLDEKFFIKIYHPVAVDAPGYIPYNLKKEVSNG
jgi:hypothetical protein